MSEPLIVIYKDFEVCIRSHATLGVTWSVEFNSARGVASAALNVSAAMAGARREIDRFLAVSR